MTASQNISPPPTPPGHDRLSRSRFDATVEFNRPLCREHFLLRLRLDPQSGPFPLTRPGQFVQLGCRPPIGAGDADAFLDREVEWTPGKPPELHQPEFCGPLALLRRPFSFAGRGDDDKGTWVEFVHRVVGTGTAWLAALKTGDAVDFIGPLGNAFELTKGKSRGLLVGGGVGLPPMFYLAEALHRAKWEAVAFVGALTRDLLAVTLAGAPPDPTGKPTLSADEFSRFHYPAVITTDDGSLGLHGRITAGLEQLLQSQPPADNARTVVYTCGPDPMMHAVAKLAAAYHVDCQVCLEQAMACGMSTCQSCVVKIEEHAKPQAWTGAPGVEGSRPWRFKLACTDGPVFDARGRVVMDFTTPQIIGVVAIVLVSTVLQTAVGFGSGLFMVPAVLWLGFPLPESVAFTGAATLPPMIAAVYQLRRHVRWRDILPMNAMRLLILPLGIWSQTPVESFGKAHVKQLIGLMVLAAVVLQKLWRVKPRRHVAAVWDYVTGAASGFTTGLAGIGGPPVVLWVMAHRWSSRQVRASMLVTFAMLNPVALLMMLAIYGRRMAVPTIGGFLLTPLALVGVVAGHWLGHRMPRPTLARMSLILLVLIGVGSVVEPYIVPHKGVAKTQPAR